MGENTKKMQKVCIKSHKKSCGFVCPSFFSCLQTTSSLIPPLPDSVSGLPVVVVQLDGPRPPLPHTGRPALPGIKKGTGWS